ncbi:MAG: ribosomal protein S18-alanine N-acetyltransferase [Erysipelotrichaceae bacterium]|nr:ribosomal protein S18-alanine N-acetyltransferase [Erysipelotrichaceae bacterium]
MKIERMQVSDIRTVTELENILFKDPWPAKFFEEELANDYAAYYVMKENDEIIGYAGMWRIFENCDLTNIAIRSDCQGKGYGEKLLRFMIGEAIRNECEFMHLEVRTSNIKAIRLYEKAGFIRTRIRKGYYGDGEDCIDMVKGLLGLSEDDFSDREQL